MSDNRTPSNPILARGAERVAASTRPLAAAFREPPVPPGADPDEVVEEILSLLSEERFQTARLLAKEAASRFPGHRRVANACRIFDNRGRAIRRPATEPDRSDEFNWLTNPPDSARGKWVALVGSKMVAAANTLPELVKSLRSKSLSGAPLVHRIE